MKKSIVLTSLFVMGLYGKTIMAGDGPNDNPGGLGFKGGIGLTTISFPNNAEFQRNKLKVGGLVGFSYEKRIGDVFALDAELLYANKGSKQKAEFDNGEGQHIIRKVKYNFHTIDLPLSMKFYIGNNFNVNFGPYISFVAGARSKYITDGDGDRDVTRGDSWFKNANKDNDGEFYIRRFDAGINTGLEFVSNGGFGVGARFQKGFVDLTNNDYQKTIFDIDFGDNKWVTNTGVQLYAIVRL